MQKKIRKEYRFDDETERRLTYNMTEVNRERKDKITESEYIRDLIRRDYLEHLGIDKKWIIDINRQLVGLGTNVNQIAHRFNSGLYDMYDIDRLEEALKDIREIREFVRSL